LSKIVTSHEAKLLVKFIRHVPVTCHHCLRGQRRARDVGQRKTRSRHAISAKFIAFRQSVRTTEMPHQNFVSFRSAMLIS